MIPIQRKNGIILIDDEDSWVLRDYTLKGQVQRGGAYRVVVAENKKTRRGTTLGRVLLGITDPRLQADHINQDGFDNRRDNLRVVDKDLQSANRTSTNIWGYKGVVGSKNTRNFYGKFFRSGVRYLGPGRPSPEKAALDYNRMAIAVWGHQIVINDVRCVDMEPRPAEKNCMFCNAPCHCCCVCFDPPSAGMQRLFDTLDAS